MNSEKKKKGNTFIYFFTGGEGVSISNLIKTINLSLRKVLIYKGENQEKSRILLLTPTGVAAINIDGTTVHTHLGINVGGKMSPLKDRQKAALSNKISELRLLIIGEISIVFNALFYQVHQRLNKKIQYHSNITFAGLPLNICCDFYQLTLERGLPI